jgi:hypothetical protein
MKSKEKVAINQLTLKEIIKDLFESSTDIESRLFRTVYGLTVKPDKVIFGYVQDQRDQYTSAFRYLLFSVFVSFISFTYFFAPQDVGGAYYLSVKNNILDRLSSRGADILFVEENFNIFYTEFIRMVTLSYKFAVCFNIPPILLVSVIFLRGIGLGIPSLFVASLFLAAHSSLLSSLFITPLMYFTDNIFWSVYGSYFVSFVYSFFGFWRLRGGRDRKPVVSSLGASVLNVFLLIAISSLFGGLMVFYVSTYTPKFVKPPIQVEDSLEK